MNGSFPHAGMAHICELEVVRAITFFLRNQSFGSKIPDNLWIELELNAYGLKRAGVCLSLWCFENVDAAMRRLLRTAEAATSLRERDNSKRSIISIENPSPNPLGEGNGSARAGVST